MPSIEAEFELFCGGCRAGICNNATEGKTKGRGMPYFEIEPCDACLEKARDEGKDKGYEEGKAEGYEEGYEAARKEFERENAA